MLPPGITLAVEDQPAEADIEMLPTGLEAFNDAQWPGHQPWPTPCNIYLNWRALDLADLVTI